MRAPIAHALLALAAACALPAPANAQVDRPQGSGRLIQAWDFEDRTLRPEPVPMHWFRVVHDPERGVHRPGFPKFNLAVLDDAHAREGVWSLKLPTRGGSTAVALARGVTAVIPESDLLLTAWLRTEDLQHAHARVVARLLDDRLEPLAGGRFATDPERSNGRWSFLRLSIPAHDDAAWIQVELQLLQPDQLADGPPATGELVLEDVHGAAWFDDLRLYQAPRLLIHTRSEANLDVAPDTPTISLSVRDLAGERLTASIAVLAWDGALVDHTRSPITPDGEPVHWAPDLPRFGWYRAVARIASDRGVVAQTACDLAWLAPRRRPIEPDPRFAVAIRDDPLEALELVPRIVRLLGVGQVWLDVWQRTQRRLDDRPQPPASRLALGEMESVTERLLEHGAELTFVLERAPDALADHAQLEPSNVLGILSTDPDAWLDHLRPLLSRFGERVRRWQIGPLGDPRAATAHYLPDRLRTIHDGLFRLIPRPTVVLPWPSHAPPPDPGDADHHLAVWAHAPIPAAAIPELVAVFDEAEHAALLLDRTDPHRFGVRAMVRDAATRAVRAWAAGAHAVAIDAPWRWRPDHERDAAPDPLLPVWRTLVETLAGRAAIGELPVAPGATAILIGDPDTRAVGAIVAWNDTAPPEDAIIHGYLGAGPVLRRDLFGNESAVPADEIGERHIPLSTLPTIIEGVDLDLLQFRSALRIEPRFIETRAQRHDVELVVTNPWNTAIGGRLRLDSPDTWRISPRVVQVNVPPGGEQRIPLRVTFGLNEVAGAHELTAQVRLSAERQYPTIRLPVTVELGLEHLEVAPTHRFVDGDGGPGADLVLTVLVTNTGDAPASLDAQVLAPGRAAQEATIHALGPGQTTLRRFRFPNARDDLLGQRLRLTIRERDAAGRFNRWIDIH